MLNIYPNKLKATRAETVGSAYKWLKRISFAAIAGSFALFALVSPLAGFVTLLVASFVADVTRGREFYIDMMYKIHNVTDLRFRLLQLRDNEYALENLAKDYEWRNEPVSPAITEQLENIKRSKEEIKNKLENFLDEMLKGLAPNEPKKSEDKESN